MTPERFRQIEELYHAAREKTGAERAALLERADPAVRRQVESLLAQPPAGEFIDRPALQNSGEPTGATVTVVQTGASFGPYRVEGKLGEGGMGEVFRAVDTRLGRAVALKVLHEKFSDRFEREARAIAALNHPHICTLYDVGPNYLVMEFIEGETLAQRLKRGKLSMEETLRYGGQIASALAAAHAKGIVHRDLKPGNIMLAQSGVKVLDFGLAKSTADETLTGSRAIMGTPAYMAPEQREGKQADARTDIYSLGCVLYEMSTGARAGSGTRVPSRSLERIVNRCLEQDPAHRWQTVAELEGALGSLQRPAPHWKAIAAALAVLVLAAGAYFYLHRGPKLTDKDTIVLADFANKTGDSVFDETLRQGLSIQLEQSPFLNLVSDQKIRQTMGLMGRPTDATLTPEIAKDICERINSAAVLDGSIASLGSQYVLALRARDCRTGDVLDEEQVKADHKEDVLNGVSQMATKFRTRVGESLATVQRYDTPLDEATTPSLEALKAYSAGWKVNYTEGSAAAIPHYKRAIEIDPKFALAYARLGHAQSGVGDSALSAESNSKAYQLRERASDREKFFIAASYQMDVTGDLEKAAETCELWAQTYPREIPPHGFLAGAIYPVLGKWEKAIEEGKKQIDVGPEVAFGYNNLADAYQGMDRLAEAEATVRRAEERKMNLPEFLFDRYVFAFLRGDQPGIEQAVALGKGRSGAEDWLAYEEAFTLAYSGRRQQAMKQLQRAADLTREEERVALWKAGSAVLEAFFGNVPAARENALAASHLSKGRDVQYGAAFALALAGDSARSQTLADDLEKRFPEDTAVRFDYLPALRAQRALNQGAPAKAIELLQTALPYQFGLAPSSFFGSFGNLYPVYVRGLAYLTARQGAEASAEFQKILNHRGVVINDPIGALARLQLGRAFVLSGDNARAKAAYQDFFALWKDADTDIPILQQARAENAKLR